MLLISAPAAAAAPAAAPSPVYFARAAREHLRSTYTPAWQKLFLREEVDADYPMPKASEVRDLLSVLQNVPGTSVHTQPATTVTEGQGYAMFFAGMQRDLATLKALTVAWQANGQAFGGQPACGGCCADSGSAHHPPREICAGAANGLCRRVEGAYMPGWKMPMSDAGAMGSATDADEDAVTGLIYLAELLDDEEARAYAVKSIAAFVLEDLGLADPTRNSRRVPAVGDIPDDLQTIWLWRGGASIRGSFVVARRPLEAAPAPREAAPRDAHASPWVRASSCVQARAGAAMTCPRPRVLRQTTATCASHPPTSHRASGASLRAIWSATATRTCRRQCCTRPLRWRRCVADAAGDHHTHTPPRCDPRNPLHPIRPPPSDAL